MKKILLGLLLMILSNLCFANWIVLEKKDEFGDSTGIVEKIAVVNLNQDIISIEKDNIIEIFLRKSDMKTTEKETVVLKVKVDDNTPHEIIGKNLTTKSFVDDSVIAIYRIEDPNTTKKLIEEFKKGNIVKIIIVDDKGENYLIKLSLSNFSNVYKRLNK